MFDDNEVAYRKGYAKTSSPLTNPFTSRQIEDIKDVLENSLHDDKPYTIGDAYNQGLIDGHEKCKQTRVSIDEVFYHERRKHK